MQQDSAAVSAAVVEFRLNNGLCHACGTRIYAVSKETDDGGATKRRRLQALSGTGVMNGRCLFCYPDVVPQNTSDDQNDIPVVDGALTGAVAAAPPSVLATSPVTAPLLAAAALTSDATRNAGDCFASPSSSRATPIAPPAVAAPASARRANRSGGTEAKDASVFGKRSVGAGSHSRARSQAPQPYAQPSSSAAADTRRMRHQRRQQDRKSPPAPAPAPGPGPSPQQQATTMTNARVTIPTAVATTTATPVTQETITGVTRSPTEQHGPSDRCSDDDGDDDDECDDYDVAGADMTASCHGHSLESKASFPRSGTGHGNRREEQAAAAVAAAVEATSEAEGVAAACRSAARREKDQGDPCTISIRDCYGDVFVGVVTEGTTVKGIGEFTCLHDDRKNEGKMSVYRGGFENGLMEGKGFQKDASGCVYQGEFHLSKSHGYGTCHWTSGWVYKGHWKDDKRSGYGEHRQTGDGGEVFTGQWRNDMWNGRGRLQFAGGGEYFGEFRDDKIHGKGCYHFKDGSRYEGQFKEDMREGTGMMVYADGTRFEGEWKDNWRHGHGTLYYANGNVYKGTFHSDYPVNGSLRTAEGILKRVRNGVVPI